MIDALGYAYVLQNGPCMNALLYNEAIFFDNRIYIYNDTTSYPLKSGGILLSILN